MDRQLGQIAQRRIAGAEVVDRNVQPHIANGTELVDRGRQVSHDDAFGDLDVHGRRIDALSQRLLDDSDEIPMAQLDRGHVNRNTRCYQVLSQPLLVIQRCPPQCPRSDVENHPGFLQQRDEAERRNKAKIGALPAHQRFDSHDASRLEVDLGLVMQDEFLVLQRVPQFVLQRQLPRHPLGHLLRIEQVALAGRFRSLERRFGILQQHVGVGTVAGKYRDPELGGDPKVWVAYKVRSAEDFAVP